MTLDGCQHIFAAYAKLAIENSQNSLGKISLVDFPKRLCWRLVENQVCFGNNPLNRMLCILLVHTDSLWSNMKSLPVLLISFTPCKVIGANTSPSTGRYVRNPQTPLSPQIADWNTSCKPFNAFVSTYIARKNEMKVAT